MTYKFKDSRGNMAGVINEDEAKDMMAQFYARSMTAAEEADVDANPAYRCIIDRQQLILNWLDIMAQQLQGLNGDMNIMVTQRESPRAVWNKHRLRWIDDVRKACQRAICGETGLSVLTDTTPKQWLNELWTECILKPAHGTYLLPTLPTMYLHPMTLCREKQ